LRFPGAKDVAVEFFTLSKSYNMPGWRVGFMVGNPVLVNALARLKSYFDYGTFTPIQVASILALEGPQECVHEICENYRRRRDVLVEGLNKAGWPSPAQGDHVRLGADPRAIPALRLSGVLEVIADGSQGSRKPRHRLRRLRRRPRTILADRK
jgi:DNA-binding transcriptional MocR family regulator